MLELFNRSIPPRAPSCYSITYPSARYPDRRFAAILAEDRVSGPGSKPIMAAFTHLNPKGDRFTDGTYGVFYAGRTVETAIAETRYHRVKFLRATNEPAQELDMRVYAVNLDAELHDIRSICESHPALYLSYPPEIGQ